MREDFLIHVEGGQVVMVTPCNLRAAQFQSSPEWICGLASVNELSKFLGDSGFAVAFRVYERAAGELSKGERMHLILKDLECWLLAPLNWVARKHAMWIAVPFITAQALATFPSKVGLTCSVIATGLFLLCLIGWRSK